MFLKKKKNTLMSPEEERHDVTHQKSKNKDARANIFVHIRIYINKYTLFSKRNSKETVVRTVYVRNNSFVQIHF